jgi:hypothetical protein
MASCSFCPSKGTQVFAFDEILRWDNTLFSGKNLSLFGERPNLALATIQREDSGAFGLDNLIAIIGF